MSVQRIDKLLSSMGLCSRREAAAAAKRGAVTVNGELCRDVSKKIDPDAVQLTYCGQPVGWQKQLYLMLHKPLGVLSATEDRTQKTVLDLLPQTCRARGVFPVGRLDKDTSGLLLLTDDGQLAHALTSPRHHVDKRYHALTNGILDETDVQAFAEGLTLRDGTVCLPAKLELGAQRDGQMEVWVTVQEGKYHQVRRMLAARGAPVLQLERVSEGPLTLDAALKPGQWRELTEQEIAALRGCMKKDLDKKPEKGVT